MSERYNQHRFNSQTYRDVETFDVEESSDSDNSMAPVSDYDFQTVFELDEMCNQEPVFPQKCHIPLGRLRRERHKPVVPKHKVEFPGRFIQGFQNGHLEVNIPGVYHDLYEPPDSVELKFDLSTPSTSQTCSQVTNSEVGVDNPPSDRFGLSNFWHNDDCNPSTNYTCETTCQTTYANTYHSDSQVHFSPGSCVASSLNPCSYGRFPSLNMYDNCSTDSGLPLNYGQNTGFSKPNIDNQFDVKPRFGSHM